MTHSFATRGDHPEMVPVDSSGIAAIGYEPELRTLFVHFLSGAKYKFFNVTPQQHQAFMMAKDSYGKHFMSKIRGKHKFERYD
jgi:hypothetical protein